MILVDTGPLIALFDPRDANYRACRNKLRDIREPLQTTIPVLTEAFHMLGPTTQGAQGLRDFISLQGLSVWFMQDGALVRAFELMEQYADQPMDFADASLLVAAEILNIRKIFTLDYNDFNAYRIRRGHRFVALQII